ncbi:Acyl dehydratase [Alteribacillus persepolensis]|uniref:Acyl dehydratase n=1 Tax=Alteribacillus persepolensis TaxID=568899 RepID=A0A1G8AVI3_9BACI|nr:MaoC family dehydratase N-terminal domain-containing protein [Alteribacillus persepolensis]SDH24864.1 Acyl dehydratase [Alteribacillus persepolensis]
MLDTSAIGTKTEWTTVEVEKGSIKAFADALGDDNPLYCDEEYAREKGYPSIVAPPTFPATFHLPKPGLDLELSRTLHGEQEFVYERPIVAGDILHCISELVDVYERDGKRKMTFYVLETRGEDSNGSLVYTGRTTIIYR